jgi:polyphenol oxidase
MATVSTMTTSTWRTTTISTSRPSSSRALATGLDPAAQIRWTGRAEGDLVDPTGTDPVVGARCRAIVDRPWTRLDQVHGARVVVVDHPGGGRGQAADGAVSRSPGVALAVLTADCAAVALRSREGVIGVAHAGWRGLLAGVVEATVDAMRDLGATEVDAVLGPCIHAECYQFGGPDLDVLAARFGPSVRAAWAGGGQAFDLPEAVSRSLARVGAELVADAGVCTACSPAYWSWRAGQDRQRQATVVWRL